MLDAIRHHWRLIRIGLINDWDAMCDWAMLHPCSCRRCALPTTGGEE